MDLLQTGPGPKLFQRNAVPGRGWLWSLWLLHTGFRPPTPVPQGGLGNLGECSAGANTAHTTADPMASLWRPTFASPYPPPMDRGHHRRSPLGVWPRSVGRTKPASDWAWEPQAAGRTPHGGPTRLGRCRMGGSVGTGRGKWSVPMPKYGSPVPLHARHSGPVAPLPQEWV